MMSQKKRSIMDEYQKRGTNIMRSTYQTHCLNTNNDGQGLFIQDMDVL